jgi:hypothetical protein
MRFAVAVTLSMAACAGCAREPRPPAAYVGVRPLPQLPPRPAFNPDEPREITADPMAGMELTGPLSGATAVRGVHAEIYAAEASSLRRTSQLLRTSAHQFLYGSTATQSAAYAPGLPTIDQPADTAHAAKIEREAQLAIEVRSVAAAAAAVLALLAEHKGFVSKDERSTDGRWNADLIVRVPTTAFDAFVDAVSRLGEVKNRRIAAVDASLEHKDVEVLLANLQAAQARYRELLQRATDPAQILAIERELERTRTDLERVQGRLELLRDRVAYATIAIGLHEPAPQPDVPAGYQAAIATGLRAISLVDVREGGAAGYLGTGLSLRFPRSTGESGRGFSFDVDVMRACCGATPARSDWAYDALVGLDLFSESLESGRRRWLNPYLGVRLGIAQTQDRTDFAAGAILGLEIVKTRVVVVGIEARLLALVGNPDGPHGGVEPVVGVDLGL